MIYRSLQFENTTRPYHLHEDDVVRKVDGGFEVIWHTSPSTTTFYPFHRIREYEEVDTSNSKFRKLGYSGSDTSDDSML